MEECARFVKNFQGSVRICRNLQEFAWTNFQEFSRICRNLQEFSRICMEEFERICMHVRMHACLHAHIYAPMHKCMYAQMHAHAFARIHTCTHACMLPCPPARTHACSHARMHACMHACSHVHMHAPMYVRRHARTPAHETKGRMRRRRVDEGEGSTKAKGRPLINVRPNPSLIFKLWLSFVSSFLGAKSTSIRDCVGRSVRPPRCAITWKTKSFFTSYVAIASRRGGRGN
jgi:hypothetical protein